MKKLTLLFALLCASVMGFAIDWSSYEWLGDGAGGGAYSNKYKVAPAEGQNVVNIQKPGWASEAGIYTSGFGGAISSCTLGDKCAIDGGGVVLYLSAFTAKETEVTVVAAQGSKTFTVYYVDGTTTSATENSNLTRTSDAALVLDPTATSTITYTTGSTGAFSFESSNTSVATVDNNGVITAVAYGTAVITVEQEADDTYKKGSFEVNVSVNMAKQASGMGFGTLHMEDVDLYDWNGNFAGNNACGKMDLYVVTWGDKLIYKSIIKEGKTFDNCTNYFCQLRTWKTDLTDIAEHWALTCSSDMTTRYMATDQAANAPGLAKYGDEIKLSSYNVVTGCGARTMKTVSYTRDYINNINTADVTAPVLGAATITPGENEFTISFAEVTSEPVFYMIEDAEHNKKYFSMVPSFVLPKDGSGITYNYSCYAIDFNGNKSDAQSAEVIMPFSVLTNLALNKQSYSATIAGAEYVTSNAVDGKTNTRWSPGGVANAQDAWWAIDLGAIYNLSSLEIVWEGAYSDNFVIYGADEKPAAWNNVSEYETSLVTNTVMPNVGNDKNNVYSVSGHARYLLFVPSHLANNGWGASFWEFRAFGTGIYDPSEAIDTDKPVISAASLTSKTHNSALVALTASDNVGIIKVKAVDSANGIDEDLIPSDGSITLTGLSEQTEYTITLTAYDAANNISDPFVMPAFTTEVDPTMPQVAAPVPDGTNKEIRPVYSNAFASILAHEFDKDGFAGAPLLAEKSVGGDEFVVYDLSSHNEVTWGMYDDGGNAIIAQDGYHHADYKGVDASAMEYMHIDIWSLQECNTINICINDQALTTMKLTHNGEGWQSFNIALSEFNTDGNVANRTHNVRWMKFNGLNDITGKMAIDNLYFYKNETDVKTITLQVNNNAMGYATAKVGDDVVTEVANGTEVTFTAVPANENYDFVNWTIGGVEVSASPVYVASVTANTNIIANFEQHRVAYCSVPVTDVQAGRTLYLTMSKTANDNEYKILLEGSAENKITGSNVYVGTGLTLSNVNGVSSYTFNSASGEWHVSSEGFGSAYITFTATNFRNISFINKGVDLYRDMSSGGGDLSSFNAFPDASLVDWNATCVDDEAPVLAAPVASPLSGTSVRLSLSATDNMAALLTYSITYEGLAAPVELPGTAGATTYYNVKGLTPNTEYTFTVTVSDGTNISAAKTCNAVPVMSAAPVPPVRPANLVLSVYSDAYESALAHDFIKNNWAWPAYSEEHVGDDYMLVYTSDPALQAQMPDVAWGDSNDGVNAIIAKDGYNDGTNKGLDVRGMDYIHFDMWSAVPTNYPEIYLNDTKLAGFHLDGSGWQSFDLPLSALTADKKNNVRWIKFIALRTPNPEEIVIDNLYFYAVPQDYEFADDADNAAIVAENDKKWVNAKINRNLLANGEWFTLCLPFDMNDAQLVDAFGAGYTLTTMTGAEDRGSLIHLNFENVYALEAGKPYLIRPAQDFNAGVIETVMLKNVDPAALKSANQYMEFQGTFSTITLNQDNQRFVGPENYLYSPAAAGTSMKSFRCYFTIPAGPQQNNVMGKRARIVFGPQTTTDFENVQGDNVQSTKVIRDGQLFIIRDNRTFNAQGQLVK